VTWERETEREREREGTTNGLYKMIDKDVKNKGYSFAFFLLNLNFFSPLLLHKDLLQFVSLDASSFTLRRIINQAWFEGLRSHTFYFENLSQKTHL